MNLYKVAAGAGKYEEVAVYISVGADPAWTDYDGSSALHWVASDGLVNIARLLLDHGWDLEARSSAGRRPLHYAAEYGQVDMLQLLAGRGAELDCQDAEDLYTPLHWAAYNSHATAVTQLLSLGADGSIRNKDGLTAEELARDADTIAAFAEQR